MGTLTARLHTEKGWRERPDCRTIPIRRPLVITGIPRTGTTALHKLLSMDPQFQGLEHWLTETPMVRPAKETWASNPAYQASVAGLEAYFKIMPEMRKAHEMVAGEVEECLEVLRQSFLTNRFGAGIYLPSYDDWFFRQDERESYRRYADVLRLIGADEPEKRWLLKNPAAAAKGSRSRPTMNTSKPSAAKRLAMARPIPRLPPVTTTDLRSLPFNAVTAPPALTNDNCGARTPSAPAWPRGVVPT